MHHLDQSILEHSVEWNQVRRQIKTIKFVQLRRKSASTSEKSQEDHRKYTTLVSNKIDDPQNTPRGILDVLEFTGTITSSRGTLD